MKYLSDVGINKAPENGDLDVDGDIYSNGKKVLVDDSGWQNLTLQNGWSIGGTETPQYRLIGSVLYFRGAVVKSTGATEVCATLPVGFRPSAYTRFPISSNTVANLSGIIATNGQITMNSTAASAAYRSLTGANGITVD